MEKIMEINSKRTDFKSKVQHILYPESNTSSSEDDTLNNDQLELLNQHQPIAELDNNVEVLKRHEEFIAKQLSAARKIRQKGILAVSSKQGVDLVENDARNDVLEEERPSGKGLSSRP